MAWAYNHQAAEVKTGDCLGLAGELQTSETLSQRSRMPFLKITPKVILQPPHIHTHTPSVLWKSLCTVNLLRSFVYTLRLRKHDGNMVHIFPLNKYLKIIRT